MRRYLFAIMLCIIAAPAVAQQSDPWPVLSQPYSAQDTIQAAGVGVFAPNVRTLVRVQIAPVEPERRRAARGQQVRPPRPLLPAYHLHRNHHHRGDHRGHQ
jgi:hypothetical protein